MKKYFLIVLVVIVSLSLTGVVSATDKNAIKAQADEIVVAIEGGKPVKKSFSLYESGFPEGGDSADVRGSASWSDGYWTLELSRALRTPSRRDVRLDQPQKSYSFGLAVWDGASGDQHQVATIVNLRFESVKE